jgi:hypothetical protein
MIYAIQVDYTVDSEGEWEEPCKDGEELRSDAEDLSDSETMDSDSDTDSFIVPHGHLSDDELDEDEQQQVDTISNCCLVCFTIRHCIQRSRHRRNRLVKLPSHMFGIRKLHDEINNEN